MNMPARINVPVADLALNQIRHLLGRSRVASAWGRLSAQQRAMICYGAKLRPSTYAELPLEQMTDAEREAIRRALVELKKLTGEFHATDRAEWLHIGDFTGEQERSEAERQRQEELSRKKLNEQARQLSARLKTLEKTKAAQL